MSKIHINVDGSLDSEFVIRVVEAAVEETVRKAVHDALYDAIKLEARKAYVSSEARGYALPKVVDIVLKRLISESLNGNNEAVQ